MVELSTSLSNEYVFLVKNYSNMTVSVEENVGIR